MAGTFMTKLQMHVEIDLFHLFVGQRFHQSTSHNVLGSVIWQENLGENSDQQTLDEDKNPQGGEVVEGSTEINTKRNTSNSKCITWYKLVLKSIKKNTVITAYYN